MSKIVLNVAKLGASLQSEGIFCALDGLPRYSPFLLLLQIAKLWLCYLAPAKPCEMGRRDREKERGKEEGENERDVKGWRRGEEAERRGSDGRIASHHSNRERP